MKQLLRTLFLIISTSVFSQITHYDWPNGDGEAILSDKYKVFVKHGVDPEEEVEVLMSEADPNDLQYDFQGIELTGRTFSFASISYNNIGNPGLTFRIVKTFGNSSTSVEISPKSYGITPSVANNEVTFSLNDNNKYISVNFQDSANETDTKKWIKHMLTIFIDPPEINAPTSTDSGVVLYTNSTSPTDLENASIIYFEPGYHNLKNYQYGGMIDSDGLIALKDKQKMYLAGGAFVEGLVGRNNYNNTNQKLYGRGVLSGRQYEWQDEFGNKPYGEMVLFGKYAEINGVHIVDSPKHGIVSPDGMLVENLKFLGWHANNDALRIGNGSEVKNSFIRAVDDFFYNYNIHVHDCVLWAGHNGAIVTFGWASYDTGSSYLENIDIINPEWIGLGNNNSIIAAQVNLDFNPIDYGSGSTTTTFKNIRIEGSIPGLVNVKPRSSSNGIPEAEKVPIADLGYLGDIQFEDITIENQFAKGRIRGQADATITGNNTFFTKNIDFKNVTIAGKKLNNINSSLYFDIEASTTQNITFEEGDPNAVSEIEIETFANNVQITHLTENALTSTNKGIVQNDIKDIKPGGGQWFAAGYSADGEFAIQSTGGFPDEYLARTSDVQYARGFAYVFNNKNKDAFGVLNMSFDYFWKSPLTGDRISYRVWGIKDPENNGIDGYVRLTGGSGAFGDNDATNYVDGTDATELAGTTELGVAEDWTKVEYTIDPTSYDYIVIVFSGAFGTVQTSPTTIFGIDNVSIPKTNPSIYDDELQIPSLIQSEDFTENNGNTSEVTTDTDGGYHIKLPDANSWVDYKVYVKKSDTYKVDFRVASSSDLTFNVKSSSVKTITVENTGDLQTWATISSEIELTEGIQTIRITAATAELNINWMKFYTVDDDKDGVENDLDECPDTPEGTTVNEKGCPIFILPSSNFSITSVSETCPNKSNGEITISATEAYDYKTTINGTAYSFTDSQPLTISNLTPGTYDFCITINGETYSQCYSLEIEAGTTISGKAEVKKSKATINIDKGTPPFKVFMNGELLLKTMNTSFEIDVNQGDLIEVKSNIDCEGVISKEIDLFNEITAYPNPTKGNFEISVPFEQKEVTIEIYNMQSQLISVKTYPINYGKVQLNIKNQPLGIYFAKLLLSKPTIVKIIKH